MNTRAYSRSLFILAIVSCFLTLTSVFAYADDVNEKALEIKNVASIPFATIHHENTVTWAIITIVPARENGFSSMPGAYIDAKGKEFRPKGAHYLTTYLGTVKVLKWLTQPLSRNQFAYKFTTPMNIGTERSRGLETFQLDNLFQGGTILCKLKLPIISISDFEFVRSIPLSLVNDVVTVYQLKGGVISQPPKLSGIDSPNAIVANEALQSMASSGPLDIATITEALSTHTNEGRSVIVYTLLKLAKSGDQKDIVNVIENLVKNTSDIEEIRYIAVGAYAALAISPQSSDVLVHVITQYNLLRTATNDDLILDQLVNSYNHNSAFIVSVNLFL